MTRKTKEFMSALKAYLVDYELTATDERKIAEMFERFGANLTPQIQKVYINRVERVEVPVYVNPAIKLPKEIITPDDIRAFVEATASIPDFDTNPTRKTPYKKARYFYCFLLATFSGLSLKEIAKRLVAKTERPNGGKHFDHTSVVHAKRMGAKLLEEDAQYKCIYHIFKSKFQLNSSITETPQSEVA